MVQVKWKDGLLLADGAMGTVLQAKGFGGCLEALVKTHPDVIQNVHRQYIEAGARVLLTQTFGANRLALHQKGQGDVVADFNQSAVKILRAAVNSSSINEKIWLAGNVGPTQLSQLDVQNLDFAVLRAVFREQSQILAEAGVDCLALETFYNAKELCMALEGAKGLGLPVVSAVTLTHAGCLADGTTLSELVAIWQHYAPDLIGINCSDTPQALWPVFEKLKSQVAVPLWVKLNAGLPPSGLSPKEFAAQCLPYLKAGVAVLGGCCGTTPEHIFELSRSIEICKNDPLSLEGRGSAKRGRG